MSATSIHRGNRLPLLLNVFLRVIVADGDRTRHFETFDVADADQALARFETLSADADRARAAARAS